MGSEMQAISQATRLITAPELAAMLHVSTRTLWRWKRTGRLIEPLKIGGATRWRLEDVALWMEEGCPTSEPASGKLMKLRQQ